jgi:hypothetical protein
MRLSTAFPQADFGVAGAAPIVRAQLGPRSRREAKHLARMLAGLCQTIWSAATGLLVTIELTDNAQRELFEQVAQLCQDAIATALAQPSQAIALAQALGGALTSLQLVQQEMVKGDRGAAAVVQNADALARQALTDVLKLSAQPEAALAALAAVPRVEPSVPEVLSPPPAVRLKAEHNRLLPLFSEISQKYIGMRIARDGKGHADIQILILRLQTFIDVVGDRPPDEYYPSDLQDYVNKMQFWPANVTKREDMADRSTLEILEANRDFELKPLAEKTMRDGYVANIRTMMSHGTQDYRYRNPFAAVRLTYPKTLRPSKPREGISVEVTDRIFRSGAASGLLDEAILPMLSKLTSRRLGLLVHLRGSDIRRKHGVWIAQTDGIVEETNPATGKTRWRRVPLKTRETMTFYVLHNRIEEIGLGAWMRDQGNNYVFAAAHEHPDPAKYMSKTMQNFFKRNGARGGEVFHSLRGDGIDGMRRQEVDNRARRLQAGHELGDEHDKYGFRALNREDCQRLANLPLEPEIDWSVFKGLDFDALARGRRSRGRRPKMMED